MLVNLQATSPNLTPGAACAGGDSTGSLGGVPQLRADDMDRSMKRGLALARVDS